ncbi:MAG: DNA internalization-related competence protein ComEC/Rec2 [Eubacteriaceae bacterium]|nr:DNA internalization-related competence protein ComEC/Rec2 [Eubacteriaceae bacterium]
MRRKLFIGVLLFALGIITMYAYQSRTENSSMEFYIGQEVSISGKILELERKDEKYYRILLKTGNCRILCSYFNELTDYEDLLFSKVTVCGTVSKPDESSNPRTFDYSSYLKSRGIHYVAVINQLEANHSAIKTYDRLRLYVFKKRESFIRRLCLSDKGEFFLKGVLFGDTSDFDENVYEEFRQNSTAHILAVSGLHLGVLYSLYKLIQKKKNNKFITILFLLTIVIYGTVTQWSVSVTRASVLIFLAVLGNETDRRYDLLTAIALIAAALLIYNPYVFLGAGFQMSFLAVTSIGFFTPYLERRTGSSLSGALAVQIGMIPYMIYNFNGISIIGLLTNIPVIYLVSLIVPIGVCSFFIFLLSGAIIPLFPSALDGLSKLTMGINHFISRFEIFYREIPSMKIWMLILIYGFMFLLSSEYFLICRSRKHYRKILISVLIICLLSFGGYLTDRKEFDRSSMVFLDVGQGDCLHIKSSRGVSILIDGGGNKNYNVGAKTLKPYLLKNGFNHVDLAIATHLHTDHYLGLEQLSECFDVEKVITEGKAGDRIELDNGDYIQVLYPFERIEGVDDENTNSMVFKVSVKGVTAMITGDITEIAEGQLVERYRETDTLKCDILKIAHHGSRYSSSDSFIDAVNPKVAVISVGKNNYGHPEQVVLDKLEKRGIEIFRTDYDGAVGIEIKKEKFTVHTWKDRK